jgi:hypothetical protein
MLPRDEAKSSKCHSIAPGRRTVCCKPWRHGVQHRASDAPLLCVRCNSLGVYCTHMPLRHRQCGNCYFRSRQRHGCGCVVSKPQQQCKSVLDKELHFSRRCLSSLPERTRSVERRPGRKGSGRAGTAMVGNCLSKKKLWTAFLFDTDMAGWRQLGQRLSSVCRDRVLGCQEQHSRPQCRNARK